MAKERNAFVQRQREAERKRNTDQKRQHRAQKRQKPDEKCESNTSPSLLSPAENAVLSIFRNYLMTPGKMLCLGSSELKTYRIPLANLTKSGLLVAERFIGGYSLTEAGFIAMESGE